MMRIHSRVVNGETFPEVAAAADIPCGLRRHPEGRSWQYDTSSRSARADRPCAEIRSKHQCAATCKLEALRQMEQWVQGEHHHPRAPCISPPPLGGGGAASREENGHVPIIRMI